MKRRHRRMLNLCSFALLVFALYVSFIRKEPVGASPQDEFGKAAAAPQAKNVQHLDLSSRTHSQTVVFK